MSLSGIDLNYPCNDSDVVGLGFDLNVPCNDSDVVDSATVMDCNKRFSNVSDKENRVSPIQLEYPSSSIIGAFPFDLNVYPLCEDVSEDECEAPPPSDDVDDNVHDLYLDEDVDAMLTEIQQDPNGGHDEGDGGHEEGGDTLTEDVSEDECAAAPPSDDVDDNVHDLYLDEDVDAMLTEENIVHETQPSLKKRSFLDNNQRKVISEILKDSSFNGKLKRGTAKRLAASYSVSIAVIYRIWRQTQTGDVCHKKTKNCGRKRIEIDIEKVRDVALSKRGTLRSLASALGISTTALMKYKRDGILRRHSNGIKPELTGDNMKARLRFCLSMLEESSIPHDPKFKSMHNVVHIDEKWFHMSKKTAKYYLLANEDEPYRTCKNKNYITKVMFLAAVARPRFDDDDNVSFSGLIGVFPLVNKVPAKRSSVNRASGTLETKPITSITKEVSRMFLINKVLPAIKEKWPRESARETIYIQQDNAPVHISANDEEFCRAASEGGFDIRLTCQPPNSPDLNVLDLGFFNAIQSLQQTEATRSVDELIQAVENSYNTFSCKDSNKIFLTLQSCMIEIMKVKGSHNYKTPHIKKDVLINEGRLPVQLNCDRELVEEISEYLHNAD